MSSSVTPGQHFLALRILLTETCNLACVFCHNEGQPGLTRTSRLTATNFRKVLCAGRTKSLRQIKFSGGEPTLHPDLLSLVTISVESGLDTVVISNGVKFDVLEAVAAAGARISINVPSADPDVYNKLTRGSFEAVIRTLRTLSKTDANVAINSYSR
ncbi:MAG: radical SAM protein, partial [Gammaproteobacteria bacterium]